MKKRICGLFLCSLLALNSTTAFAAEQSEMTIDKAYSTATITVEIKDYNEDAGILAIEGIDLSEYEIISSEVILPEDSGITLTDCNEDNDGEVTFAFVSTKEKQSARFVLVVKTKDSTGIADMTATATLTSEDEAGEEIEIPAVSETVATNCAKIILHPFRIVDGKPVAAGTVYLTSVLKVEKGDLIQKSLLERIYPDAIGGKFFTNSQWKQLQKHDFDLSLDGVTDKSIKNHFTSINPARTCDGYTDLFCIIE